jgi:hypothetical protein
MNRVGREGSRKTPSLSIHRQDNSPLLSPCHVTSCSFLLPLPSPYPVFALQMLLHKVSQARFCRQPKANNERAVLARPVGPSSIRIACLPLLDPLISSSTPSSTSSTLSSSSSTLSSSSSTLSSISSTLSSSSSTLSSSSSTLSSSSSTLSSSSSTLSSSSSTQNDSGAPHWQHPPSPTPPHMISYAG